MAQEDLIAAIVREVMGELNGGKGAAPAAPAGGGLDPVKDYPLAKKRPDLVKTPNGKSLDQLTQNAALEVKDAFLSIAKNRESLRAAREGVQLAAESLRLQQALYESGAGTLLEWDNARLGLRRAQVSLIQAEISLLLSHLRFHTAIGE